MRGAALSVIASSFVVLSTGLDRAHAPVLWPSAFQAFVASANARYRLATMLGLATLSATNNQVSLVLRTLIPFTISSKYWSYLLGLRHGLILHSWTDSGSDAGMRAQALP
jgi:hypothetical protein